jgi:DhnA family fructose-bisphosphate aldolase class Ia
MGAIAVGATIYFGNDSARDEIAYVSDMFEEAHDRIGHAIDAG